MRYCLAFAVPLIAFIPVALQAQPAAPPATAPSTLPAAPAGVDDPQAYAQLVEQVLTAREHRKAAADQMQKKLKELSQPGLDPVAAEKGKRELMMQRRITDIEAEHARKAMDMYWLVRTLQPRQREEFLKLEPADQEALLEQRNATLRLAVPLPPANFSAASVDSVLAYIQQESGVRIVGDWPSLKIVGMEKRSPVSIEIGRYNRPAIETLKSIVNVLTKGQARVDVSFPEAAIITTDAGVKEQIELRRKLQQRGGIDFRAWDAYWVPLEPVALEQVPLADALFAGIPQSDMPPLYVDWAGLAAAGITPRTPVDLRLGVHTIGERLAILAEAVADRPEVRQHGGMKFDILPVGEIVLSSGDGFRRIMIAVNRLTNSAQTDAARNALKGRMPEVVINRVSLQDTIDFFRDATHIDIRADWNTLANSGLTPQTPVDQRLFNVPLGFALAIVMDPPANRPPVVWEIDDGKIVVHGGQ